MHKARKCVFCRCSYVTRSPGSEQTSRRMRCIWSELVFLSFHKADFPRWRHIWWQMHQYFSRLTLCMLGNFFKNIFFFKICKKSLFPTNFLCLYIIWMSNSLDLRWSPTICGASSGSKLFAKVINGLQNSQLAG